MRFLVFLLVASASFAGCIAPSEASPEPEPVTTMAASADNPTQAFRWEGASPVDVFVCATVAGCPGFEATETEWVKTLPGEDQIHALELTLTWEPAHEQVGPMVFLLNQVDAQGTFVKQHVRLSGNEGSIVMALEGINLNDGHALRIQAWPEARNPGQPVQVFIDPWEQPYVVEGNLAVHAS